MTSVLFAQFEAQLSHVCEFDSLSHQPSLCIFHVHKKLFNYAMLIFFVRDSIKANGMSDIHSVDHLFAS